MAITLHTLSTHSQLAVIGGGPAGLRAAEVAALCGLKVSIYDGKPSVGRKLLVAGKGGLNLTHGESFEGFVTRYSGPDQPSGIWNDLIGTFDPAALREWAAGLGIETFQATSGRVYPKALKAAPLLRRWIERLRGMGVTFEMNHRWAGLEPGIPKRLHFSDGQTATADSVVFAMGGGSWAKTGSDGGWIDAFQELGVECTPLAPANCGWQHEWSAAVLEAAEGKPLKNVHVRAEGLIAIGELMVTRYGLEGGAIYQLGSTLRTMERPAISIDFKPTFTFEQLAAKMESVRRDFLQHAVIRWKLSEPAVAILARKDFADAISLAREVKNCVILLERPRPIDEAISSAGGVKWTELDGSLMLKKQPGIFVAGEMIDWEAPTGGYLMQGCFASGTRAGGAAVEWLRSR